MILYLRKVNNMFKIFIYTKLYLYHVKEYNITKHLYKLFIYTILVRYFHFFQDIKVSIMKVLKKLFT